MAFNRFYIFIIFLAWNALFSAFFSFAQRVQWRMCFCCCSQLNKLSLSDTECNDNPTEHTNAQLLHDFDIFDCFKAKKNMIKTRSRPIDCVKMQTQLINTLQLRTIWIFIKNERFEHRDCFLFNHFRATIVLASKCFGFDPSGNSAVSFYLLKLN